MNEPANGLQHRTIQANGLEMHVAEQGTGPLVLLVHGFPENWYAWRHQLPALAEAGYRAAAPDMRGYGQTSRPAATEAYALKHLVADMVGLLDALEVERAVIVGNDWGATVAWQAALTRPDRFQGVVALGVPLMGRPPAPPTTFFPQTADEWFYTLYFQEPGLAEAELERDVQASLRKILFAAAGEAGPRWPGDATPNPFGLVSRAHGLLASLPDPVSLPPWLSETDLATYTAAFRASGFSGALNYYRNLDRNWSDQAEFADLKLEVPALYLVGERDTGLAIPGMTEIIAAMPRLAPKLRGVVRLPGAGHWLPQERPQEVSDAIIEFMKGLNI